MICQRNSIGEDQTGRVDAPAVPVKPLKPRVILGELTANLTTVSIANWSERDVWATVFFGQHFKGTSDDLFGRVVAA